MKRISPEQFLERLKLTTVTLVPGQKYTTSRTKLLFKCSCGKEWEAKPDKILLGQTCSDCRYIKSSETLRFTQSEYEEKVKNLGNGVSLVAGQVYVNSNIKLKHECSCGNIWEIIPSHLLKGTKCRACANESISKAKKGRFKKPLDSLKLREDYLNKKSLTQLAETHNVTRNSLMRRLEQVGIVNFRGLKESRQIVREQQINEFGAKRIAQLKSDGFTLLDPYESYHRDYHFMHDVCGNGFVGNIQYLRCYKCFPLSISLEEEYFSKYIASLDNVVIKLAPNSIHKYELDIYLPNKRIAFEYNGSYFHSSEMKDKNYHYDKSEATLKAGVKLYTIWDYFDKDKVKYMINAKLGIFDKKIAARKCDLVFDDTSSFFESYHLFGNRHGVKFLSLKYKDSIVASISYFEKKGVIEIARYCNFPGVNITGGFAKLLSELKKLDKPIHTYADIDWTPDPCDNVYVRNGFKFGGRTAPDYTYTDKKNSYPREMFQKHKLKTMFPNSYSDELTEVEIMRKEGYIQVYGSGSWIFNYDN